MNPRETEICVMIYKKKVAVVWDTASEGWVKKQKTIAADLSWCIYPVHGNIDSMS